MKLTIQLDSKEICAMANVLEIRDEETLNKSSGVKGHFGSIIFNAKENKIDIEIKTPCVMAYMGIIASTINLIKSFISTINIFVSSWFEDVEEINFDEETKEEKDVDEIIEETRRELDELLSNIKE